MYDCGKLIIQQVFGIVSVYFDIQRLEEGMIDGNKTQLAQYRKKALKSGRRAVSISRKAIGERTEILKMMGTYYWLIGRQKKARKWWKQGIAVGEYLGARLELSRTYMEVGRRLLDPKSKYKELNGISAQEYLQKARTMLQEMDLLWDLDELERISAGDQAA